MNQDVNSIFATYEQTRNLTWFFKQLYKVDEEARNKTLILFLQNTRFVANLNASDIILIAKHIESIEALEEFVKNIQFSKVVMYEFSQYKNRFLAYRLNKLIQDKHTNSSYTIFEFIRQYHDRNAELLTTSVMCQNAWNHHEKTTRFKFFSVVEALCYGHLKEFCRASIRFVINIFLESPTSSPNALIKCQIY